MYENLVSEAFEAMKSAYAPYSTIMSAPAC